MVHIWWVLVGLMMTPSMVMSVPEQSTYPGKKPEICFAKLTSAERNQEMIQIVVASYKATKAPFTSPESIWDQTVLKSNPALYQALEEYIQGKRGQQARHVNLENKTAEAIHQILIKAGFTHERVPLNKKNKSQTYWKVGGQESTNPKDPGVIIMDVYTHPDGSIIRVKPEGIPDESRRTPLRSPHYSKSVLLTITPKPDIHFNNQAFKLTAEGDPVPKSPSPKHGFRYSYLAGQKRQRSLEANAVMSLAHFELPTTCVPKKKTIH